ncbi:Hypothetical_protein [Hexamita inflata]|uniref:Hypothetical_protein n=1 Tax=Hexamita inflata TaxID=28002 RepID=A0ABP1HUK6_9EUKA
MGTHIYKIQSYGYDLGRKRTEFPKNSFDSIKKVKSPDSTTPGLESGNRSIASLETQMVRRRWISVYIGSHEAAASRPWMLVPESLVALAAEARLTYIGVSKTNDHSRGLPVQKTELVQTKVK